MDQFRVHEMSTVKAEIEKCRTDIVFIPKGLTFLLQPCDVFVNKPFKDAIRKSWEDFMLEQNTGLTGKNYFSLCLFN